MAIPGTGCFVAWYDLQPGREADHDEWHTHEHMIERVAISGFLRGLRYRSLTGSPRTCVIQWRHLVHPARRGMVSYSCPIISYVDRGPRCRRRKKWSGPTILRT
jgi:hypothetical protein